MARSDTNYEFKNLPGMKREPVAAPRESFGRREALDQKRRNGFSASRLAVLCCVLVIGAYIVAQLADVI